MASQPAAHVAVVGGGIIGLSIAWELAQRGLEVSVFDAGEMAAEASRAGAGMLAPGGEAKQATGWARDTVEARRLYRCFVERLREATSQTIDFRECGGLDIAFTDAEWSELDARRRVQAELGIDVEEVSQEDARHAAPMLARQDLRALHYPEDAVVDPRDITRALLAVLKAMEVRLHAGLRIGGVTYRDGRLCVHGTNPEPLAEADAVVLAAGAWTSEIAIPRAGDPADEPARRAFPIRGHLVGAPLPRATLGPIVRSEHLYVFQRESGEVIAGSNEEHVGFSKEPNPAAVSEIRRRVERVLPGLLPASGATHWLGFRPGIEGDGPEVRRLGTPPLWLAYGHYRNGILLAPHTAKRIAEEVGATLG